MTDIFQEVEEDVRRERAEKFFKAYGQYIIALLIVVFLAIGGYEIWQSRQSAARAEASGKFIAAQRVLTPKEAAAAFAGLQGSVPAGYQTLARLSQANALYAAGQHDAALSIYKDLAAANTDTLGAVARLRAGWAMADTMSRDQLADWLKPLNAPASAWRQMAQEILAYADFHAHDNRAALAKYAALAMDPQAPDALRARARAMGALLAEGGMKDFGTVPAPAILPPGGMPQAAPQ